MAKVKRTVIHVGIYHQVECAVTTSGSEPAKEFLDQLAVGSVKIRDIENPDEKQPDYRAKFLANIFSFADGEPVHQRYYNFLSNGIWEFKAGDMRLSFYDTDGEGNFTPKNWRKFDECSQIEVLETFDDYVRLGHSFAKPDRHPPEDALDTCHKVREEDLHHDRH